jgi:hypothetical protein
VHRTGVRCAPDMTPDMTPRELVFETLELGKSDLSSVLLDNPPNWTRREILIRTSIVMHTGRVWCATVHPTIVSELRIS